MTRVYRLLRRQFSESPLDGEGAYRFGGRWSSPGTRLAYTSEHLSLAMLEFFVHLEWEDSPKDLVLVTAEVPDNVSRESLCISDLPEMWRSMPPPPELATIGDRFVQDARSLLLIVPSVLAPTESNWLINPRHPDFGRIQVGSLDPFEREPLSKIRGSSAMRLQ